MWPRLSVWGSSGAAGKASTRSDIGLGRSYDARRLSSRKTRFLANLVFFLGPPSPCNPTAVACVNHRLQTWPSRMATWDQRSDRGRPLPLRRAKQDRANRSDPYPSIPGGIPVSEALILVPPMSTNYDDIITNLTVSSSPPWSDTYETVGKKPANSTRV